MKKSILAIALLSATISSINASAASSGVMTITNAAKSPIGVITNLWWNKPSFVYLSPHETATITAPKYEGPGVASIIGATFNKTIVVFLGDANQSSKFLTLKNNRASYAHLSTLHVLETVLADSAFQFDRTFTPIEGHKITIKDNATAEIIGRRGNIYNVKLVPFDSGKDNDSEYANIDSYRESQK